MNVLILTPDRVGSTLLQRLITVYANINENGDPLTIGVHELTNGINSYYNETLKRQIVGKIRTLPNGESGWGYHQSLPTVIDLLESRNHDAICRVAHYHIKARNDSLKDQLEFYQYLNDNFFIIATRRKNLFEHALSWAIVGESKHLHAYGFEEKYQIFKDIEEHGIDVQEEVLTKYLNTYMEYTDWVDRYFRPNAYFEYERDLPDIENFILNLNCFKKIKQSVTWQDRFNIDWTTWNRMHYLLSLIPFDHPFDEDEKEFMKSNIDMYTQCRIYIQDLQDAGVMISGIPIKLHTLKEKAQIIKNIDQCLINYNNWISYTQPSFALSYKPETLNEIAQIEYSNWTSSQGGNILTYNDIKQEQLMLADLKFPEPDPQNNQQS